ncbi:MAG: putative divalent heavy-metal cations transporter [Bacteroidetes bacterium]|nr:MAG: putative divalent heavy-metal cations transporter [Bacteroidota bacterium]
MILLSGIVVFLSVFASGISMLFIRIGKNSLKMLLAFSGAFLLTICVMHLIPEIYRGGNAQIGIFILAGFFLQLLLDFFTEGVEHGHTHVCEHDHAKGRLPVGMLIGVCLHSFLEGLPLTETGAADTHAHHELQYKLLAGISLHNIPIAVTFMSMLLHVHIKKSAAVMLLLVFALMTPLGLLTSELVGAQMANVASYYDMVMAVVVGIFLHISTTILFESNENHRFNLLKFVVILLGTGVALGLAFLE